MDKIDHLGVYSAYWWVKGVWATSIERKSVLWTSTLFILNEKLFLLPLILNKKYFFCQGSRANCDSFLVLV